MNTNDSKSATVAFTAHLNAVSTLLLDTMNVVESRRERASSAAWADVSTMARARELAVRVAWPLGAITVEGAMARLDVTL